jgi:hypothetical protein
MTYVEPNSSYLLGSLLESSKDGGGSWQTISVSDPSTNVVPSGLIRDGSGNLFDISRVSSDPSNPAQISHWVVRRSSDDGQTWSVIDDYSFSSSDNAWPSAIAMDAAGEIFVVGSAFSGTGTSPGHWVVRKYGCPIP